MADVDAHAMELIDILADEAKEEWWDEIAERLGYEDLCDAESQGVSLRADWLTNTIVAEKTTQDFPR